MTVQQLFSGSFQWGVSVEVQHGRELAAQAIEDEARAYEAQFGVDGPGGEAAAVMWKAAQIARGGDSAQIARGGDSAQIARGGD